MAQVVVHRCKLFVYVDPGLETDLFISLGLPKLYSLLFAAPSPFVQVLPFVFVRFETISSTSTTASHLLCPCVSFPDIQSARLRNLRLEF